MLIRQLITPRSATVFSEEGTRLLTIELLPQVFGYDVKKNESIWYEVDFLLTPGNAPVGSDPIKGAASIRAFCDIGPTVDELHRNSSKYLRDDAALSVREPIKEFNDSTVTLFYREGRPWFHLKLLGTELDEAAWTPDLLGPLRELAEGYQAERAAFEAKMKSKVEREGKSDD